MSVESYIRAMPKVELNVQLEGAMQRDTLLMIADQNEIRDQIKRFDRWVEQYKAPDFKKLEELSGVLRGWMQYGDDLVRAVYDVGLSLSKRNVRYAEITINPLTFVTGDFTFEAFMQAINDGRNRAERAWGIQMRWVLAIPRGDARYADEVARWATSATGRNGGVVGLALVGYDKNTSLDQFERAFHTATKKNIHRIAYLNAQDDIDDAIEHMALNSVVDGWGVVESPETLIRMREQNITLSVGPTRAQAYGWTNNVADYPMAQLLEYEVPLIVSSDMPTLFDSDLNDEYMKLIESELLTLEQLEAIMLRAVEHTHMDEDERHVLQATIEVEMDVLRAEHLLEEDEAPKS